MSRENRRTILLFRQSSIYLSVVVSSIPSFVTFSIADLSEE